ncbi:aminotransferase yhxA [Ammoniphilus resinae]|uniref:aminotransferase yhxA n=1 Tax=Ammoniphilus resinae TaxID=861532 RepID=UPI003CC91949
MNVLGKTGKVMAGISTTVLALGLAGCGSNPPGPPPNDPSCRDWEWDSDDGVWVCDDRSSSHSGSYYHGGRYYKSKSSLQHSSAYKSYKSSSSFKGSSGFGSGSKSFFGG